MILKLLRHAKFDLRLFPIWYFIPYIELTERVGPGARHYEAGSYRCSICVEFVSECIQTLVKHIGSIDQNEPNLQYTHLYATYWI